MNAVEVLAWLFIGHALADYPLQGAWLAKAKNPSMTLPGGERIWVMAMLSHTAIHAGAVRLVTGSWLLAGLEFVAHTWIDYLKCRVWISYNQDQLAHVFCKIVWACLFAWGVS
jgi:hypothetical protein